MKKDRQKGFLKLLFFGVLFISFVSFFRDIEDFSEFLDIKDFSEEINLENLKTLSGMSFIQEKICESTGIGCPKVVNYIDLTENNGIYYEKFSDVPFSGNSKGIMKAKFKKGKMGEDISFFTKDGEFLGKGKHKNGEFISGIIVIYYDDLSVKIIQPMKNKKLHGKVIQFDRNGCESAVGEFINGKEEGIIKTYRNCELTKSVSFKSGKLHGPFKEYMEYTLTLDAEYKNGKPHGIWYHYLSSANGRIWKEEHFYNGEYVCRKQWNQNTGELWYNNC